MTELDRRILTN